MALRIGLFWAVAVLACASSAGAATIGSAQARVSLALEAVSAPGGSFSASAFLPDILNPPIDTSFDPGSSASASNDSNPSAGSAPVQVGDQIAADVSAQSRAVGPLGFSDAFVQAGVVLQAFNPTASALEIDFLFGVDLFSSVSVDDIAREFSVAFSDVSALISGDDGFDPLFRAFTEADSDFGPYEDAVPEALFPFSLTLAPNTSQTIALIALAQTDSASLVPAPVPLPLPSLLLFNAFALLSLIKLSKRIPGRA